VQAGGQEYEVFGTGGGAVLIVRAGTRLGFTAGEPAEERVAAFVRTFFGDAEERRLRARRVGEAAQPTQAEAVARQVLGVAAQAAAAAPGATPPPAPGVPERLYIYRGTTWALREGVGGLEHDLGAGLYLSPSETIAATYADERRRDERNPAGAPGIVYRLELGRADLGRILDLWYDSPEKRSWNDYLDNDPMLMGMGRRVKAAFEGGNTFYRSFFLEWLRKSGLSLDSYDVVIAPDYRLRGPQIVFRNRALVDAFVRRATERARAVDAPGAFPDPRQMR
jgi:hypothetical protein